MHCWWIFDFETDYTYKFFVLVILLILAHHSFLRFIYYLKKNNLLRNQAIQNQRNSFSREFPLLFNVETLQAFGALFRFHIIFGNFCRYSKKKCNVLKLLYYMSFCSTYKKIVNMY
jgi:hypothetical protein